MAKKKKGKRAKKPVWDMPPLTKKDRLVYNVIGWPLLCFFPCELVITILWAYLGCRSFKKDPTVLFYSGEPTTLAFLWAGGVSVVGIIILLACRSRKPLWGEKGFHYGQSYYPHVYPLFLKEGPERIVLLERVRRWVVGVVFVLLVLPYACSVPLPGENYMEFDCVHDDGTLCHYNQWKELVYTCPAEEVTAVQFRLKRVHPQRSWTYSDLLEIQLQTEETVFGFSEKVSLSSLQNALKLRARYPEDVVSGVLSVKLDWVQHEWRNVPQVQAMLAELFENAEQNYVDRFGVKE